MPELKNISVGIQQSPVYLLGFNMSKYFNIALHYGLQKTRIAEAFNWILQTR